MKRFTKINEAFTCRVCGAQNPPAQGTCRNHCRECLHSIHVDNFPGDRAAGCEGLLVPTDITTRGGQMEDILFVCQKCGAKKRNRIAEDDSREALMRVFENGITDFFQ